FLYSTVFIVLGSFTVHLGLMAGRKGDNKKAALWVALTLVKATYSVMTFMHLGDERRNIRSIILLPYALFILYLLWIALWESNYVHWVWTNVL
ncbi:MAG: cytochrome C oxidase subunit IV family protein, partial [Flavobacteriales bacterium]